VTGSSWTTAGTLGVALVGIARVLGVSPAIAAGAVISGAYLGDKMTPLSETTILVPKLVGGVTTNQHIKAMMWTSVPSFAIALVVFAVLGFSAPAEGAVEVASAQAALMSTFTISVIALLPLVLLFLMTLWKTPPFLALMGSSFFAGVLALFIQQQAVTSFVGSTERGPVAVGITAIFSAMATGFVSVSGNETIDTLFSGGGMASMLSTVWLIFGALSFAAIIEHAGFLERLIAPLVARARTDSGLIASVLGTAIGLNVIAGDQYVSDVMTARAYPSEFQKRGIAPHVLSRAVEDSGTVTSPLIPWNSCGAYMAGVLGVATLSYLPYCVFNIASPIIDLVFVGLLGFKLDRTGATNPALGAAEQAGNAGAPPKVRGT
jgi:NhaC family Na+:H+ antiporter